MGLRVNLPEPGDAVVRVDLRGLEGCVTQEFLDFAHVGASVEQVCGERVSEDVGAFLSLDAASGELLLDDAIHGDPGNAFSFVS